MISTFEIFKIIIGIVIAGFFLFFALKFLGVLAPQQIQKIEVSELKGLKNIIEKTLVFGVSQNLSVKTDELEYSPPYISRKNDVKIHDSIPLFLKPGDFVYIYPKSLDIGFWKMDWVGVLPDTKIIYNPVIYTPESYKLLYDLTEQFPESSSPAIVFGLCGGETEYTSNTKTNFLKPIKGIVDANQAYQIQNFSYTPCVKQITGTTKITISDVEVNPSDSFVVILGAKNEGGVGIFISDEEMSRVKVHRGDTTVGFHVGKILFVEEGKAKEIVYKDSLDIFALVTGGEQAYKYKNDFEFSNLLVFLKNEIARLENLRRIYSNPQTRKQDCVGIISTMKPNLENLKTVVEATASTGNYNSQQDMELFNQLVDVVAVNYEDLNNKGCD